MTKFRWWYKGKDYLGNVFSFEGTGWAEDSRAASRNIESMMREKHPELRWMQGRAVEGGNIQFGPTILMSKQTRPTTEGATK